MYETRDNTKKKRRKLRKENKGTRIWNRNRNRFPEIISLSRGTSGV